MRRNKLMVVDEPGRPSHFREDKNVSVPRDNTEPDYGQGDEPPIEQFGFMPAPEPAPVYMVEAPPADRSVREWSPATYLLTTAATSIAGNNPNRSRLCIRNTDATNSALLTRRHMDSASVLGFELPPGEQIEMLHNREVWARSNTGTCELTVFVEFALPDE